MTASGKVTRGSPPHGVAELSPGPLYGRWGFSQPAPLPSIAHQPGDGQTQHVITRPPGGIPEMR